MKLAVRRRLVLGAAIVAVAVPAVAGAKPPPGAMAKCRDGTISYSQHHRGTCSHHHGVAVWYR